jgi:hypothetical protein
MSEPDKSADEFAGDHEGRFKVFWIDPSKEVDPSKDEWHSHGWFAGFPGVAYGPYDTSTEAYNFATRQCQTEGNA